MAWIALHVAGGIAYMIRMGIEDRREGLAARVARGIQIAADLGAIGTVALWGEALVAAVGELVLAAGFLAVVFGAIPVSWRVGGWVERRRRPSP